MTTNDIDAIRKLTDAATDAPWNAHTTHPTVVWQGSQYDEDPGMISTTLAHAAVADADFIAAARTLVPALCDEIEQLRAELARVNGAFNDAVAELSERYAERDKLRAAMGKTREVVEAAKAWRDSDDIQLVGVDEIGEELVAAIDALAERARTQETHQ